MDVHDMRLERARHHIAAAETRVMRQSALVAVLAQQGCDTEDAQKTLLVFQDALDAMRHHLAVETRYAHADDELRA